MSAERHAKQERRHARRVVGAAGLSTISAQQGAIEQLANSIEVLKQALRDEEARRLDMDALVNAAALSRHLTLRQRLRWIVRGV